MGRPPWTRRRRRRRRPPGSEPEPERGVALPQVLSMRREGLITAPPPTLQVADGVAVGGGTGAVSSSPRAGLVAEIIGTRSVSRAPDTATLNEMTKPWD